MRTRKTTTYLWLFTFLLVGLLPGCTATRPTHRTVSIPLVMVSEKSSSGAPRALVKEPAASARAQIPARQSSQQACLVGQWAAANMPQALNGALNDSQTGLTLKQVEGQTKYEFGAGGEVKITFNHVVVTFDGELDRRPVTVKQSLDGSGTARYQLLVDDNQMLLSDFGGEGVHITLDINKQRLVEGTLPAWQTMSSWLSGWSNTPAAPVQTSRVSVACSGDTLKIISTNPSSDPDVILLRVQ